MILLVVSVIGSNGQHGNEHFTSKKISKTATFLVNESIEKIFPLFGAFEERKWAPNWKPVLIYPDKEIIEEGTTFKHKVHRQGSESETLWIIIKFEPQSNLIQYLVSTENRFWTITVKCKKAEKGNKTNATVTYSFTGLNEKGNKLNQKALHKMYQHKLQDWADLINGYFQNK